MKNLLILLTLVSMVVLATTFDGSTVMSGIPPLINYQGMLTDAAGTPLNGTYMLILNIYDAPAGGILLWGDTVFTVVTNGLFNVVLGSGTWALNLVFDKPYWLEVKVNNEVMPRVQLTSVGYAYRASVADSAVVAGSGGGGGGWVDDGAVVRLESSVDTVEIGTTTHQERLNVNGGIKVTGRVTSTVSTGTAPFNLSSSTKCDSLNADMVDGVHASSFMQIRAQGTVSGGNSATLVIPHYIPWTLQLASGWPDYGGVCFVQGFENDRYIGVTYIKYNGDGAGGQAGGAEGYEGTTTTLVSFGLGSYTYSVKCPGEAAGDHNIVLNASGSSVELSYRLVY